MVISLEDETVNLSLLERIEEINRSKKAPEEPAEPTLKEKLIKVLEEDPGVAKLVENPWLHAVWVQKLKELVK